RAPPFQRRRPTAAGPCLPRWGAPAPRHAARCSRPLASPCSKNLHIKQEKRTLRPTFHSIVYSYYQNIPHIGGICKYFRRKARRQAVDNGRRMGYTGEQQPILFLEKKGYHYAEF